LLERSALQLAFGRRDLATSLLSLLAALIFILASPGAGLSKDGPLPSKLLATIKQRGEIAIGVKTDFAPFGYLDARGAPMGLEVDLALQLASDLGVRARLVPVTTENRFARLEQGAVDLIIATAGDTKERRLLATAIEPSYYGSGVNVLLPPESSAKSWQDMRGQKLCALQGAYFNRGVAQHYFVDLVLFRSVRDALLALQDRRCSGFVYTEVAIDHYLAQPHYSRYTSLPDSALVAPWAISVPRSERGADFATLVGDIVAGWHRSGLIIDLEKKWNVRPSKFLQEAHELWNRKKPDGAPFCERSNDGQWTLVCRNRAFITAEETEGSQRLGLWLRENLGVNLPIIYDPYDRARYLWGLINTILLSFGAIAFSLVFALAGAATILTAGPTRRRVAVALANIGRLTPPLLQMYILFFGVSAWLHTQIGVALSPLSVGILALGLYHGCIILFAFLDGAEALKRKQKDFRLSRHSLPDLLDVSAVGVRSAVSNLIKATTIAAAISVPELLSATIAIIADQGNPDAMMPLLLVVFYCYSGSFIFGWMWLEKKIRARRSR
jgi:polar amino acid transport system substrate-binding protein